LTVPLLSLLLTTSRESTTKACLTKQSVRYACHTHWTCIHTPELYY
jgi:hypothetical protein